MPDLRHSPCLTDDELLALREVGRKVERHYGKPQDIEWALDKAGSCCCCNRGPETVWSVKDAQAHPVAPPSGQSARACDGHFRRGRAQVSLTGKDIAEIARLLDASQFTALDLQLGEIPAAHPAEKARGTR